jgi:hypothetical protein
LNHQCGGASGVEFLRVLNTELTETRIMTAGPMRPFGLLAVNSV